MGEEGINYFMNMNKTVRSFIYDNFMWGSPSLDFHTHFMEFLVDTHPSLTDTIMFTFQNMDSLRVYLNPTFQDKDQAIATLFDQCELFNKHIMYVEYKAHDMEGDDGRWYDVVVIYLVTNKI